MTNGTDDAMDNEVVDNDSKITTNNGSKSTANNNKTITDDNDISSSTNSTLIGEGNTEVLQVQPMESLTVKSSYTHPQPKVISNKENVQDDSRGSVSGQSTPTQSCSEMSETITHPITQPKIIGKTFKQFSSYMNCI